MPQSPRTPLAPPPPPPLAPAHSRRLPTPPPPPLPVSRPVPGRPGAIVLPTRDQRGVGDEQERLGGGLLRSVPSWLMSAVVHLSVMIILGMLYVAHAVKEQRELEFNAGTSYEDLGDPLGEGKINATAPDDPGNKVLALSPLPRVEDPTAAPGALNLGPLKSPGGGLLPAPGPGTGPLLPGDGTPAIGPLHDGRQRGSRGANLKAQGGDERTEESVQLALQWLVKQQQADGSWSLSGPFRDGVAPQENAAATAMAMLAFQGTGNTHKTGEFAKQVLKGKDYLVSRQLDDGSWRADSQHHRMYAHAQCTIALCELYAMTQDSTLRLPAEKAIKFCITSQSKRGGWRYTPGGQDADVSVTGWFVLALQSAKMAKLEVPLRTWERVSKFLDEASADGGSRYGYFSGDQATASMTAEALVCREWLGWPRSNKSLQRGIEYLASNENLPRWEPWNDLTNNGRDVYFWYYAAQALHHYDGPSWYKWNRVMKDVLTANQIKSGAEAGTWEPRGDKWGRYGGRLYVTCLSAYILEVYYRHLPIYASTGKSPTGSGPAVAVPE